MTIDQSRYERKCYKVLDIEVDKTGWEVIVFDNQTIKDLMRMIIG